MYSSPLFNIWMSLNMPCSFFFLLSKLFYCLYFLGYAILYCHDWSRATTACRRVTKGNHTAEDEGSSKRSAWTGGRGEGVCVTKPRMLSQAHQNRPKSQCITSYAIYKDTAFTFCDGISLCRCIQIGLLLAMGSSLAVIKGALIWSNLLTWCGLLIRTGGQVLPQQCPQ